MRNNRDLNHLVSNPPSVQVNIYKVHVTQHASTKDTIPEGEFEYSLYLLGMSHMAGGVTVGDRHLMIQVFIC